ncbi:hypothetical protein D3Y57_07210 [Sphingomonas paeninsulae]|uniref:Uncharacterized protein n=2 Tax=Sphingomonas paeninsulae TaxID=2319844 RepID=A0A494TJ52_SPHPE|nr:hypothetical protein D3Y57_07210 [Sphingomonas paeninsulae]
MAIWGATKLTESNWLISVQGTAEQVRDIVITALDGDDTAGVFELTQGADWATRRVGPAANAWLSTNVTPAQLAA